MKLKLSILLTLIGCRIEELSRSWQLDRVRILGAQAEPAEPAPGDIVHFKSLVFTPEGIDIDTVIWFVCLPESANDFGCNNIDPSALSDSEEPNQDDISDLMEAGFAGAEPFFPPQWQSPEDVLDDIQEEKQIEGISALATIIAIPAEVEDEEEFEIAYKRFPISTASITDGGTQNHNPEITNILVGEEIFSTEEEFVAKAESTYTFTPILSESSIEDYNFINRDGEVENRTEEPYFTWYLEGGSFNIPFSLYPYNSIEWTAPKGPFSGRIISVVRDRRGGMAWNWIRVKVPE